MLEWQQRKSDALQDLFDGDFCKTHPLLLKEVSIPIVIYQDDCETVNPLGSKTAVHRLGCIEHLLSSLQSHFLLAVYKSLDAKTYGLDTVLRPIVEEIQCLERDGITVDTPSFQGVVKFTVVQVVGDNLGLNAMLGYTESFSGNYVCRFCRADKEILRSQTVADPALLRDVNSHKADLHTNNPKLTGLKRDSVLNDFLSCHRQHGTWYHAWYTGRRRATISQTCVEFSDWAETPNIWQAQLQNHKLWLRLLW